MRDCKHRRAIEFSILQTLRFIFLALILVCMCFALAIMQSSYAAVPLKGSIPQNPCAAFYALQKTSTDFSVVKVQLLGVQNGVVGVMILGLPKHVQVSMNGIDLSKYLSDTTQIQCSRQAVGELRSYDLSNMPNMDAGYFQIKADSKSAGASISLQ